MTTPLHEWEDLLAQKYVYTWGNDNGPATGLLRESAVPPKGGIEDENHDRL